MERKYPRLFSPFTIRNTTFKNRIIASPLGDWRFSPHNFIVDYAISFFEAKAAGGAAEVTFGHTEVNAEEPDTDGFGLYHNLRQREGIAALAELAAAIKQHGALASMQLNYSGYFGPSESISRRKVMLAMAEEIIADGKADFVAMCRALVADPEWPNKVRRGQEAEIRPCLECYNCLEVMHHTHYIGCDVNPRSGQEHRFGEITPAKKPRKVIVVGGGPAGMQAAITASERGHQVTLYEKSGKLGGILTITDNDPLKILVRRYKDYLVRQVKAAVVTVKLNTEATPEIVESQHPDVVIVAAGSYHIIPDIPGIGLPNVFTAIQAHQPGVKLGKKVVIVGGNLAGCETALFVRDLGKEATVIEMIDRLHADANFAVGPSMEERLKESGVRGITGARCTGITKEGVQVLRDGQTETIPADSVILAVGMRSNAEVFQTMYDCAPEVIAVGDCLKPGTIRQASRTGYFTARDI